jgi:hypothetical protein
MIEDSLPADYVTEWDYLLAGLEPKARYALRRSHGAVVGATLVVVLPDDDELAKRALPAVTQPVVELLGRHSRLEVWFTPYEQPTLSDAVERLYLLRYLAVRWRQV